MIGFCSVGFISFVWYIRSSRFGLIGIVWIGRYILVWQICIVFGLLDVVFRFNVVFILKLISWRAWMLF